MTQAKGERVNTGGNLIDTNLRELGPDIVETDIQLLLFATISCEKRSVANVLMKPEALAIIERLETNVISQDCKHPSSHFPNENTLNSDIQQRENWICSRSMTVPVHSQLKP